MTGRLTLFGERKLDSPFVFTAFVALKEKGVPFDFRLLDLAGGEQRSSEFARRSLTRRVPTLEAGGFALSESVAIVEYLEETLPAPAYPRLLPASIEGRARVRQVLGWLRTREPGALRRGMVCYAGDDTTDEYAFEALEGRAMTIVVGKRARGAAYRTASPASLTRWLGRLAKLRKSRKD